MADLGFSFRKNLCLGGDINEYEKQTASEKNVQFRQSQFETYFHRQRRMLFQRKSVPRHMLNRMMSSSLSDQVYSLRVLYSLTVHVITFGNIVSD